MKIKTLAHSIWGRVSFTLLLSFLVLSQTANADVTNCANGAHLPSAGTWNVLYNNPKEPQAWLGDNHKVIYVHNPASGTNVEEVNLTGDVNITDRVYVGLSTANGVNPTGNAKLIIRNTAGRTVTIKQYIWGSRTKATDTNGTSHNQTIDNNCMFSVWGKAELVIEGTKEHPIIIDGGSTQTDISNWEANKSASSNLGKPFNKIIWGLIESNGSLTLRNVVFKNVVFSNMYAGSKDSNGNFYCDCSCIKLNSAYSSTYPYVLGNTILENVTFEGVESPAGGGCILTCYSNLNANPSNTKSSTKITMTDCKVRNTKQNGTDSTSPYVQGLMRFNANCCADVEMSNCTFENNTATRACAGIYWSSNCTDSKGQRPRLTINNGTYKNNKSIRGSAIYVDYGDVTMTGNATFEGNEATTQEGGAVFLWKTKDIKVENAVFRGNKAPQSNGGAIRLQDQCNLTISNSAVFDGNYAGNGGAMYVYNSTATIGKATFSNNYATQSGGALYNHLANTTIQAEALFEGNHADGNNYSSNPTMYTGGGAIYSYEYGVLNITNATFRNNYALPSDANSGRGGAIMVFKGGNKSGGNCLNIDGALFEGNKSKVGGGAVFFMNNETNSSNGDFQYATIKNATFRNNVSAVGGAIGSDGMYANDTRNIFVTLENNVIENNWACLGGGLAIQEAKVTYNGGLIRNNTANHRRKKDLVANSSDETIDTSDGLESLSGHTLQDLWDTNKRKAGYGGGVAVTENGILTFDNSKGRFGIYNNIALLGGDDIIGDGSLSFTTSVQLPDLWSSGTANLDGLNLPAELKAGIRWMEDYPSTDDVYPKVDYTTRGSGYQAGDAPGRYRTLSAEHSKELVKKTIGAGTYNKYVAVALGYPFIYVTIEKTGLKKGDTAIFDIYGNKDASGDPYMRIAITNTDGDEDTTLNKIVALTPGAWTVKETNWSYTYNATDGKTQIYNELKTDEVASGKKYVYSFKNKAKDNQPPHAESNVQNELTKSN